ncbi:hypothetical protein E8E11_005060 [Didymella keratinophila]|nr:hypothetical protein E8E11_005060 [Didymella keratinophila]
MKPAKTADIPVDDKDLRSCEWLIEIAQYVDLGIMKALDEPEWQALIGKGDHKRPSGDSIVKRFEDSVEGREQLDTSEIAQFVNERAWWEDWIVERLPYHQIKRERFRNGSCEDLESELIEKLLAHVDSGHDGLLKALLFARLERLENLSFVTRSQEAGSCLTSLRTLIAECIKKKVSDDEKKEEATRKPCDRDNCTAERDNESEDAEMQDHEPDWDRMPDRIEKRVLHSKSPSPPWPAGFLIIQKLAVEVGSGTWMDDDRDEEPCEFSAPPSPSITFTQQHLF